MIKLAGEMSAIAQSGHRFTHNSQCITGEERTVTTMADPPNKTDSITVDELLGMAYDTCGRDYRMMPRQSKSSRR